ncbi:HAD family hydrolase [Thalassovita taeanensis]|uniref:phosphoglycolate phosphatase n=1 Tax=Thalassovita taeanensis TaxID=657014 RepID=A0A1H9EQ88_9RHOB|nr:HAD family hydrolase [Thalassovita taeanensis]SEQ27785.1 phosphoglycolate phosphatase [Thalassovita taeanensis]
MQVKAVLFDKDGTLFDFRATWDVWAAGVIADLSQGDAALAGRIADAAVYDLGTGRFHPGSPIIAGTNREAAECIAQALPGRAVEELELFLMTRAAEAPLAPAVPLVPFLAGLSARGMALGVMTNDTEHGARAHLTAAGVLERFDFIAGFDSGYGAKPDPEPLLAFAQATGVAPEAVVMVGDSTHDLIAGRRAGMQTLGVLTGTAGTAELHPYADAVLPDIGHIPGWLDTPQG